MPVEPLTSANKTETSTSAPPGCFSNMLSQARHKSGFRASGACQKMRAKPPPIPPNGEAHTLHRGLLGNRKKKPRSFRSPASSPDRKTRHISSSAGLSGLGRWAFSMCSTLDRGSTEAGIRELRQELGELV